MTSSYAKERTTMTHEELGTFLLSEQNISLNYEELDALILEQEKVFFSNQRRLLTMPGKNILTHYWITLSNIKKNT